MRRVLATFLLCLGAIHCFAQFDMASMTLMQSSTSAAMNRADIRKELKLSRDQDQAIAKVEKELMGGGKGPRRNDPNAMADAMAMMGKYEQADKDIDALLDEKQKKRLVEIRIQMMGPPGLQSPLVAGPLELTDEQKEKVKAVETAHQADMVTIARSSRGKGLYEGMAKKRAEADAKLLELLTDAQKAKYKEIQGAPFKDARLQKYF